MDTVTHLAAVRTLNTLIKYTETSGHTESTLIHLCHFHLIVERIRDMGVQFRQVFSKFVTSFIYLGSIKKCEENILMFQSEFGIHPHSTSMGATWNSNSNGDKFGRVHISFGTSCQK